MYVPLLVNIFNKLLIPPLSHLYIELWSFYVQGHKNQLFSLTTRGSKAFSFSFSQAKRVHSAKSLDSTHIMVPTEAVSKYVELQDHGLCFFGKYIRREQNVCFS